MGQLQDWVSLLDNYRTTQRSKVFPGDSAGRAPAWIGKTEDIGRSCFKTLLEDEKAWLRGTLSMSRSGLFSFSAGRGLKIYRCWMGGFSSSIDKRRARLTESA